MMNRILFALGLVALLLSFPSAGHAQIIDDLTDRSISLSAPVKSVAGKQANISLSSPEIERAFNGVVAQGTTSAASFKGWIRFEANGAWTDWRDLHIVRSATSGAFVAGYRDEIYRENQRFELRFEVDAGAEFRIFDAGVFDNREDEDRKSQKGETPGLAGKTSGHIAPPPLITRAEWGAAPFIRGNPSPLAPSGYEYLTFHHAAGFRATTIEEGKAQVKAIQDLHQNIRGWSDIGYQFLIDRGGHLYQGRPFLDGSTTLEEVPQLALGAHVGGHNTGNIGVSILGCYHPPEGSYCEDYITPEAMNTYITLFAFLSERYGVAPELIRGHRDFSSTACPGDNNYPLLGGLRTNVYTLLATGNAAVGEASLAAAADAEGVVHLAWEFLIDLGIVSYRIERTAGGITTNVFEGNGAEAAAFVDAGLSKPGMATYALYAQNASGREQKLAEAEVAVAEPGGFVLTDNFPNPFSDRTTIRYFLEKSGVVKVRVYDVSGREVRSLVDEFKKKGQWYFTPFDAGDLPSGPYFYRISVDGFAGEIFDKTRTLIVVR